jgi:hypothetical protein
MNSLRKTATTLGGIFLAVLLIAVFAPKVTRGVAAALVQVVNTTANPVPTTSVSNLVPFFANLCLEPAVFACQPNTNFFIVPSTTPDGVPAKWLVIEQISASCTSFTANVSITPDIVFGVPQANTSQGITQQNFDFPTNPAATSGVLGTVADSNVHIYIQRGFLVRGVLFVSPSGADGLCFVNLQGHLEI